MCRSRLPALDVIAFDVEGDEDSYFDYDGDGDPTNDCTYDYLLVNGVKYCGTSGPAGVVPSDGNMAWVSDEIETRPGWTARTPLPASLAPTHCPIPEPVEDWGSTRGHVHRFQSIVNSSPPSSA